MSAPMVAGAAALMLQINKELTAEQVREILIRTARRDDQTGPKSSHQWGAGKLDVQEACKQAMKTVRPDAPDRPKLQKRSVPAAPQPTSP